MSHEYRVVAAGHTHAGFPLRVGDVVTLSERRASAFPHVFQRELPSAAQPSFDPAPATETESED